MLIGQIFMQIPNPNYWDNLVWKKKKAYRQSLWHEDRMSSSAYHTATESIRVIC